LQIKLGFLIKIGFSAVTAFTKEKRGFMENKNNNYNYVIVGGGLAGASAVEGIRECNSDTSVLMIGYEPFFPYHRPPLTKGLWFGKKTLQDLFVKKDEYYTKHKIDVKHGTRVITIDPVSKSISVNTGMEYRFDKLLLATGGTPNRLGIPGGEFEGIIYYRYLDDYLSLDPLVKDFKTALIIGGGFIGTEIAEALSLKGLKITMLFPESYPCFRVFPESLGNSILGRYRDKGIVMLTNDKPAEITRKDGGYVTNTEKDNFLKSDIVIAGIGISPSTELATIAGLSVANGVLVNRFLQTSHPDIYAAGDNAYFPDKSLGISRRVEHWDNALNQGKHAGKNMAGAGEPYTYQPYFFSDLFELGYEAVGDIDSKLETRADWVSENEKGIVYYLQDGIIRGVLLCNVWGKVDDARAAINNNEPIL
jgi:3-phenylpropionate/trans-cinnamate dioxygenase ferredoxin reductase subunit